MNDDIGGVHDVVVYRLERANHALVQAGAMIDLDEWDGAVNRIYYACFYAATALLLNRGLSSRKHAGVRGLFNQHFVKTNAISKDYAEMYNSLFDLRQLSDYRDFVLHDSDDVRRYYADARRFIEEIRRLVEEETQER